MLTKKQWDKIQETMDNICIYMDIMYDYCNHNIENVKIYPLITLIEQIKLETKKITDKF